MYTFAIQAREGAALTLQQILKDIPHDLGAIFVYLLLGFFLFLVVYGSRPEVIARYGTPETRVDHTDGASRDGTSPGEARPGIRGAVR